MLSTAYLWYTMAWWWFQQLIIFYVVTRWTEKFIYYSLRNHLDFAFAIAKKNNWTSFSVTFRIQMFQSSKNEGKKAEKRKAKETINLIRQLRPYDFLFSWNWNSNIVSLEYIQRSTHIDIWNCLFSKFEHMFYIHLRNEENRMCYLDGNP